MGFEIWRRPTVAAGGRKKDYYDFRRTNDGETYEEIMGLPPAEVSETEGMGWLRRRGFFRGRDRGEPAGGQVRYQILHRDEIKHGIYAHARELGFGSEMELDPDDLAAPGRDGAPEVALTATREWAALRAHAPAVEIRHLRDLLDSQVRTERLTLEVPGLFLDWSRQKVVPETMALLFDLARAMDVDGKIARMRRGDRINTSERRAVLHTALRAPRSEAAKYGPNEGGVPVSEAILASCDVRDRLFAYVDAVRAGDVTTAAGEAFASAVVVGIGGSYLGPEFVLRATAGAVAPSSDGAALGVRFVANVDPVAFDEAIDGLDPRKTLVIVVSKSWSTAETLRNAAKARAWIADAFPEISDERAVVEKHFVACASRTAADAVKKWGIDEKRRLFEFWNWVGGRYSSSASAGLLPVALARGSTVARRFLDGAHAMDEHFFSAPLEENAPAVMALLGVWNVNFLGLGARAVVPYAHDLDRFAAHVQQLEMESNGKSVTVGGAPLDYTTGEIIFGEPGTNAQHSFFQLLHCGQAVPTDFIGFARPASERDARGHDVLMANFFAQPDALAVGRTFEDVVNDVRFDDADGEYLSLSPHRTLSGDRPSLTLLFDALDPEAVGSLLALYEHRCAVQGFVWGINRFDQWGVELGKDIAKDLLAHITDTGKRRPTNLRSLPPSTANLIARLRALRGPPTPE